MGERSGYTKVEDESIEYIKMGGQYQVKEAKRNMRRNKTTKPKEDVEIQAQRRGAGL